MKKLKFCLSVALSLVTITTLSSCRYILSIISMKNDYISHDKPSSTSLNTVIGNSSLEVSFSKSEYNEIKSKQNECKKLVSNGNDYSTFISKYNEIINFAKKIDGNAQIEYIFYSVYGDSSYRTNYNYFSTIYQSIVSFTQEIERSLKNSNFKTQFFVNDDGTVMTDEEIEEYIGVEYSDKFYDLQSQAVEISNKVDELDDSSSTYTSETNSYYKQLVKINNELAKEAGYDNYLDYAYSEIYSRNYTYKDAQTFSSLVGKYLPDASLKASSTYTKIKSSYDEKNFFSSTNNILASECKKIKYGDYLDTALDSTKTYMSYFEDYSKTISDNCYNEYNNLWNNGGYYYITYEENGHDGAFTTYLNNQNSPAIVIGQNYTNILTLVHEFGHYYAYIFTGNISTSYDLCETQSQGNELLFLNYLINNNEQDSLFNNGIMAYMAYNYYGDILMSTFVSDFEIACYTAEDIDNLDLENLEKEIINKYSLNDKSLSTTNFKTIAGDYDSYWRKVVFDNACYYISYAVSLVPALDLGYIAKNDYAKAVETYNSIVDYDLTETDYVSILTNAGLSSPFNEQSFKNITSILS